MNFPIYPDCNGGAEVAAAMRPALHLSDETWELTVLPVDEFGRIVPDDLRAVAS